MLLYMHDLSWYWYMLETKYVCTSMWYVMRPGVHTCRGEEAVKVSLSIYILIWPRPAINLSAQVLLCRYIYTFKILHVLCTLYVISFIVLPLLQHWFDLSADNRWFTLPVQYYMNYSIYLHSFLSVWLLVASELFLKNSSYCHWIMKIYLYSIAYLCRTR